MYLFYYYFPFDACNNKLRSKMLANNVQTLDSHFWLWISMIIKKSLTISQIIVHITLDRFLAESLTKHYAAVAAACKNWLTSAARDDCSINGMPDRYDFRRKFRHTHCLWHGFVFKSNLKNQFTFGRYCSEITSFFFLREWKSFIRTNI